MLHTIRGGCRYGKYKHDGQNYAVKFMKKHEIIKLKQVDHINGERTLMQQVPKEGEWRAPPAAEELSCVLDRTARSSCFYFRFW